MSRFRLFRLVFSALAGMIFVTSVCFGSGASAGPDGISATDWAEIRAVYEAGRGKTLVEAVDMSSASDPVQEAYLKASNVGELDSFGQSVAVSGDTVVVGAFGEDSGATGSNGNEADESVSGSGAAYVFVRTGGVWTQQAYLKASNPGSGDEFGVAVAISGDTVVVGARVEDGGVAGVNGDGTSNSASGSGAAYVFVRNGTTWTQEAYLKASAIGVNDLFGSSVGVSGNTVVVGAVSEDSSSSGVNGVDTDNSASGSGAAYVFERVGGVWTQQAYLKASNTGVADEFGTAVAISGETVVVGASNEGSSATGVGGDGANNASLTSGAAYVFVRDGMSWQQQAYLKASNTGGLDQFGASVAVAEDTVVVGAVGESSAAVGVNGLESDNSASTAGAAYVFVRNGSSWSQEAYLKAGVTREGMRFGNSVALSGNTIVIGANRETSSATGINGNASNNTRSSAGAAYVFTRTGTVWTQFAYLKASNTDSGDEFGFSVGVSGDAIVVGAKGESSNATGINAPVSGGSATQSDDSAFLSGAAYVFSSTGEPSVELPTGPSASAPTVKIAGKKRVITNRPRVVLRGTAAAEDLVRVEVKVGKAKFRPARGLASWRLPIKPLPKGRTVVRVRAFSADGSVSPSARLVIIRG